MYHLPRFIHMIFTRADLTSVGQHYWLDIIHYFIVKHNHLHSNTSIFEYIKKDLIHREQASADALACDSLRYVERASRLCEHVIWFESFVARVVQTDLYRTVKFKVLPGDDLQLSFSDCKLATLPPSDV